MTRAIYIAQEYNNTIIGIVLADSEQLANVYFQGRDEYPHHFKVLSLSSLENHPTGVIPIAISKHISKYDVDLNGVRELLNP